MSYRHAGLIPARVEHAQSTRVSHPTRKRVCVPVILLLAGLVLAPVTGYAQPSGGPYGPIPQTYEVPKLAAHVYYVAPGGKAEATGTSLTEPTTLESAIARVVTGDAIIMRGGTYRTGGLEFNQGITIQPYRDEVPVLKGTQVATVWESLRDGVWRTPWKRLFPQKPADWWQRNREGMRTPLHRFNNDMVFVDGEFLQSAEWEGGLDSHSYSIDYEGGFVYIAVDPKSHLVEITAYDSALVRTIKAVHGRKSDKKGPTIRGITFTQYAYRALEVEGVEPDGPADPATFGKDVVGTTLESVTITYCSRVAAYLRGDRLVLRNSLISDTSTEGIYIIGSADVLLEHNIFRRNNIERITGYYPSAVKIFNQSYRVTCRDNLVVEQPYSNGIWYDVGNVDGVFVNNWVENAMDGFFFEISKGAVAVGNVFVNCDKGIRILNSSNVRVYQNTLVNTVASFERTPRSAAGDHFGWHPATGPDVDKRQGHVFVGNLLVADPEYRRPLLNVEQSAPLCGRLTEPQLTRLDGNVYVRRGDVTSRPLITWSPVAGDKCTVQLAAPAELSTLPGGFETHSRSVDGYFGALFKSPELRNYELASPLPKTGTEDPVPDEVRKIAGWKPDVARLPGAYAAGPVR
jgi:parallel beta-helix repeat protein